MSNTAVGILLAAGQSSRFGSNKLLHPMANGTPMVVLAARHLCQVLPDSIAVVDGASNEVARALEPLGMDIVVNASAEAGIGSSIACGIAARPQAAGWLITMGDMPYIKTKTIQQVADRLKSSGNIVAPLYQQQRGHPVGFHQQYRQELLRLDADTGARNIITKHKGDLQLIETDDSGVIADIDRTEDL